MKIVAHRLNDIRKSAVGLKYAEVDIQLSDNGLWVVKHDVDERYPVNLDAYLKHFKGMQFFVDIKQSLCFRDLVGLYDAMGPNLLGFFDLPYPLAYNAACSYLPVFGRLSEFEPPNRLFDRYWLDPLEAQKEENYVNLIAKVDHSKSLYVASPELHGATLEQSYNVWKLLRAIKRTRTPETYGGFLSAIVTKFPVEAEAFFNGP